MQHAFDYKQFIVLKVDDNPDPREVFKRCFGDEFRILTAASADEGLNLLKQHRDEVGVLLTNYRMPGHNGVWLLEQAHEIKPHLIRILFSAACGGHDLLAACRLGIYRYITSPWDPEELMQTLRVALEQFELMNALVGSAWPADR